MSIAFKIQVLRVLLRIIFQVRTDFRGKQSGSCGRLPLGVSYAEFRNERFYCKWKVKWATQLLCVLQFWGSSTGNFFKLTCKSVNFFTFWAKFFIFSQDWFQVQIFVKTPNSKFENGLITDEWQHSLNTRLFLRKTGSWTDSVLPKGVLVLRTTTKDIFFGITQSSNHLIYLMHPHYDNCIFFIYCS